MIPLLLLLGAVYVYNSQTSAQIPSGGSNVSGSLSDTVQQILDTRQLQPPVNVDLLRRVYGSSGASVTRRAVGGGLGPHIILRP